MRPVSVIGDAPHARTTPIRQVCIFRKELHAWQSIPARQSWPVVPNRLKLHELRFEAATIAGGIDSRPIPAKAARPVWEDGTDGIEWALDTLRSSVEDVSVDQFRGDIFVSLEFLDRTNVVGGSKQVSREGVARARVSAQRLNAGRGR